jgi:hypothetical protein
VLKKTLIVILAAENSVKPIYGKKPERKEDENEKTKEKRGREK